MIHFEMTTDDGRTIEFDIPMEADIGMLQDAADGLELMGWSWEVEYR